MTIQKQIQQYYRKHSDRVDVLRLCLAKPLPLKFDFAENHPGTLLKVEVDRKQGRSLFEISFSNKVLIEFEEYEENVELTNFLSHVLLFNPIEEEDVEGFFFEALVQREFYEHYLWGEPVNMDFTNGRIKPLAITDESEKKLKMVMKCERISTFFSFTRAYVRYCAKKLHFIKNQPHLKKYLSNHINTNVDLAEYDFFHN